MAVVGVPLAMVVTGHVLLRKRDIAASIGWIGLAWFSPVIGAGLYYLLGISRVRRRARQARPASPGEPESGPDDAIDLSPQLALLEQAARHITGERVMSGHRVDMLRNGDEAYPAMLEAIAGATATIGLSTYIMRVDRIGTTFIAALAAAKRRGVDVRVIVDGIGSGYFLPGASGALRRENVPVGRFMHSALPWRMPFLNLRSHKKLLVVDARTAFLGGMNIADEDVQSGRPLTPVLDTHFRIDGPVARSLVADFGRDWSFVTGEELGPDWFAQTPGTGGAIARMVPSGPDEDIEKIEFVILEALACSHRSVCLMTPYFLPGDRLVTAMATAAIRGIRVDLIVPTRSNHRFVDWATRAHVDPLLDRGVRIWLDEPPFDHTKLMVVDDRWCFVGSANCDMRSFRLNFELNVEIYDSELADRLTTFMRSRMKVRLTADDLAGRSLPVRLRDAGVRLLLPYL